MQSANNTFSSDPYFAPLENAAYGPSTVPPQLFPNPPPVESFDLSWPSPPPATNLLYNTPFPNLFPLHPFETPWFAESAASQFPPLDNNQHGCSFQPVPLPSASSTGSSAETHITPTRRVRNGKRRGEETRIEILQNDKYVIAFTEAQVTCAGCHKPIKLDTRNGARHYPGFWVKHRGICKGIKK